MDNVKIIRRNHVLSEILPSAIPSEISGRRLCFVTWLAAFWGIFLTRQAYLLSTALVSAIPTEILPRCQWNLPTHVCARGAFC